jgi:hypothetical protein
VLATSQIAMPRDVCDQVFAASGYEQSRANFARMSLERDPVFRDGVALETPTVGGALSSGLSVSLDVGV